MVHETHRPPAPILRYIDQIVGMPSPATDFRYSQGVLTRFDVDVVHVAEPNLDLLLGTRGAGAPQRLLASLALARNLRRHRVALVRTLHPGIVRRRRRIERLVNRVLDDVTNAYVVFDESAETPDPTRTTVIPHAHFRERFVGYPRGEQVRGRMLCIAGSVLPESARDLLAMARVTNAEEVTLRLAGVAPEALEASLRSVVARHPAVLSARFESLSDGARVQEIDSAELVVIPQTDSLEELQLVFVALSRDRPVLTPRTDAMAAVAASVGASWVHLTEGPITAEAVDTAFAALRAAPRQQRPALDGRDLATTRAAYAAVFRHAASVQRTVTHGADSLPKIALARERTDTVE